MYCIDEPLLVTYHGVLSHAAPITAMVPFNSSDMCVFLASSFPPSVVTPTHDEHLCVCVLNRVLQSRNLARVVPGICE